MTSGLRLLHYFEYTKGSFEKIRQSPTETVYRQWYGQKQILLYDRSRAVPGNDFILTKESIKVVLDYIQEKMLYAPDHPSFTCEGLEMEMVKEVVKDMINLIKE